MSLPHRFAALQWLHLTCHLHQSLISVACTDIQQSCVARKLYAPYGFTITRRYQAFLAPSLYTICLWSSSLLCSIVAVSVGKMTFITVLSYGTSCFIILTVDQIVTWNILKIKLRASHASPSYCSISIPCTWAIFIISTVCAFQAGNVFANLQTWPISATWL